MNHLKRLATLALLAIWMALPAIADTGPATEPQGQGCVTYTLCNAQTATGTCTVNPASGDELVAIIFTKSNWSFNADESTATTFSCNIQEAYSGHDSGASNATDLFTTALSQTQYTNKWGGVLTRIWAECATITGGNVTIRATACPASE